MRRHVPAVIGLAVVALLAVLVLVWAHPTGRDGSVLNLGWNGLSEACGVLDGTPLYSYDELNEVEMPATLVVSPRLPTGVEELKALDEFTETGGTLVLLDDFGHGNQVLEELGSGVRFSGTLMLDPLYCYKDSSMPRVECMGVGGEGGPDELSLDYCTWVVSVEDTDVWARSSVFSYGDLDGNGEHNVGEPNGPFPVGVAFPRGNGMVVVLSDSSVLLNGVVATGTNLDVVRELVQGEVLFDQVHMPDDEVDLSKVMLHRVSAILRSGVGGIAVILILFSLAVSYACYNRERHENE
ncbi:MAG: DUF4350 domain-containing protein [Dehalococcoidia bacterium]|nr:MAG: DUF4350 domain-containing protein [Dehalococcoidia bacterium]